MTAPSRRDEGPDRFLNEMRRLVVRNESCLRGMINTMKMNVIVLALNVFVLAIYCTLLWTTDLP